MKKFRTNYWLGALLVACSGVIAACGDKLADVAQQGDSFVEVWKTPTCGCCSEWVEHLEENGFTVKVNDVQNTDSFRAALGMPQQYGSCHSAKVAGYAIEGHVPADDIKKLLTEKPANVVGLSVPAMPMGSPGMEHPDYPSKRAEYNVLLVSEQGEISSFTHYEARP
ncbi:DUF411 domain-containing protein [Limnobacter sp.]|jgi:hypothetical protein|uniref:DUF411 domain-containing protein n=1 Tax=Limnobacter sp. TaxID=2003368 RepID=UPI0027355EF5|nr:DUF411 domain-containing protein [Limnobacter sp.]MDP3273056.1 DUF411 domain-containing protein [Limnobacter sp.]